MLISPYVPLRFDVLPRLFDGGCVAIEALDLKAVGCSQGGGEPAVATAQMNDEAALNLRGVQNFGSRADGSIAV